MEPKNLALILLGGLSKRFSPKEIPKQFHFLEEEKRVFEYSLETFCSHGKIDLVLVVCAKDFIPLVKKTIEKSKTLYNKVLEVIPGGEERYHSVHQGLLFFQNLFSSSLEKKKILIHDGARPLISKELIGTVLLQLDTYLAVTPVIDCVDTPLCVSGDLKFESLVDRKNLKMIQTPQGFYLEDLLVVYEKFIASPKEHVTDDISIFLKSFKKEEVGLCKGEEKNKKITYAMDLEIVRRFL